MSRWPHWSVALSTASDRLSEDWGSWPGRQVPKGSDSGGVTSGPRWIGAAVPPGSLLTGMRLCRYRMLRNTPSGPGAHGRIMYVIIG